MHPTVFVVDDDAAVRDSLRWLLESVGHAVETYASGAEFLDSVEPDRPGCLLLDVRMPGMSGLELQDALQKRSTQLPIIMITAHGDVPMAVRALRAGAFDFIQKPFNDQVLIDRIHDCLAQERQRLSEEANKAEVRERFATLTPREREVLEGIVAGKPNKVLADEMGISIKTVEIHRARVRDKLKADSIPELVAMSLESGVLKGKPRA